MDIEMISALDDDIDADSEGLATRLAFDVPLLHFIAEALPLQATYQERRLEQQRTIFDYVHEIAASDKLSLPLKTMLCAAMHGSPATTAAQAALRNDNPGAAAAMMCGILSASADADVTQVLMQDLGVSPREVLSALDGATHRDDAQWAPLLQALLGA